MDTTKECIYQIKRQRDGGGRREFDKICDREG